MIRRAGKWAFYGVWIGSMVTYLLSLMNWG